MRMNCKCFYGLSASLISLFSWINLFSYFFRLDFTQSKPVSLSDDTSLSLGNLCPLNFGPNLLTLRILDSSIGIIGLPQQKLISICTDNFSLFTAVVCIQHSVHLSFSVFISFLSSRPLSLYSPHFSPPSLISHSFDLCLSSFPPFYLYLSFTSHFQSGHKNQQCSAMHT